MEDLQEFFKNAQCLILQLPEDTEGRAEWLKKFEGLFTLNSILPLKGKHVQFDVLAHAAIKHIADNYHPHTTLIVTSDSAQLLEGVRAINTNEYIPD